MPSGRFSRIVLVTLGLSATGVIVGGLLGGLLVGVIEVFRGPGFIGFGRLEDAKAGAFFGAIYGAVLAPLAAWALMRHVPLWRAITETAVGTLIGAGIGMVLEPRMHNPWLSTIPLGFLGFALAAVRLRLARRKVAQGDVTVV